VDCSRGPRHGSVYRPSQGRTTGIALGENFAVDEMQVTHSTAMKVLEAKVKNPALLELDRKALDAGRLYIDHTVAIGAVTQADGFAQ
jgi:hypothetical protein